MSSIDDQITYKIDSKQQEIIKSYLDDNGKLSCIKAFVASKKAGIEKESMSGICKSLGIKITDCELGVFGKIEFNDKDEDLYNLILKEQSNKQISCSNYWEIAKKSTLRKVGSTVKNSDLDVTYCQLGCFRLKKGRK